MAERGPTSRGTVAGRGQHAPDARAGASGSENRRLGAAAAGFMMVPAPVAGAPIAMGAAVCATMQHVHLLARP